MKIIVVKKPDEYPGTYPALTLWPDPWDDYGFQTTYAVTFWSSKRKSRDLSKVKILRRGMARGRPLLSPIYEKGLPEDYGSIGADFDYYEQIVELGENLADTILETLRDLATNDARYARFRDERAFNASLIRLSPAKDALKRIRDMAVVVPFDELGTEYEAFGSLERGDRGVPSGGIRTPLESGIVRVSGIDAAPSERLPLRLKFTPSPSEGRELLPQTLDFDFSGPEKLPRNMIALVGPNGTGKTTLLADLALSLFFGSLDGQDDVDSRGDVSLASGSVRELIFVSYSAYDSFEIPEKQGIADDAKAELEGQGYIYVGLRKLDTEGRDTTRERRRRTLKSIKEIEDEFASTLAKLDEANVGRRNAGVSTSRRASFVTAIKELFNDPSLAQVAPLGKRAADDRVLAHVKSNFPAFSTGHKAVLNIVASLCLHLKSNSLVLMDEPEAHLHPPLIASLLKVIRKLLDDYQASAIVATHSPVVIQETLGRHVIVLNRVDRRTNWRVSERETFGENLATITRETLGLPAANADYIGHLKSLIDKDTQLEEVEKLFGDRRMSSPARAQAIRLIASAQARIRG